mgnify:CR=1 FL=1
MLINMPLQVSISPIEGPVATSLVVPESGHIAAYPLAVVAKVRMLFVKCDDHALCVMANAYFAIGMFGYGLLAVLIETVLSFLVSFQRYGHNSFLV